MTDPAGGYRTETAILRTNGRANPRQRIATMVIDLALVSLGFWVLRGFLGALAWAVVLTVATWPLYERFITLFSPAWRRNAPAIGFTLIIALVFIIPLGIGAVEAWRELTALVHWLGQAEKTGLDVPEVTAHIPYFGPQITTWWIANLSAPGAITELLGRSDTGFFARMTQQIGVIVAQRLSMFAVTILTLFFLFRDGQSMGQRFRVMCNRLMGPSGDYLSKLTVSAIRGTADGLVLVGLGEGAILTLAYEISGVPHPALLGGFTALLAIIPFGAPVMFSIAALLLLASAKFTAAIVVFGLGWLVLLVADHFLRPALIGGAAKLPFLWVLLGIFGGLESFGVVGLFLGPAIMAALVSMWREWTEPVPRRLIRKAV